MVEACKAISFVCEKCGQGNYGDDTLENINNVRKDNIICEYCGHDNEVVSTNVADGFSNSELIAVFELARLALAWDYDGAAEELDMSDDDMYNLRNKITSSLN